MKVASIQGHFRNHPHPPMVELIPWWDLKGLGSVDVFVQNNIIEQRLPQWYPQYKFIKDSNKPFMTSESPVFRKMTFGKDDRRAYHRWSWRSYFQDEGDYNNEGCPSDRWEQIQKDLQIEIKDWSRKDDGYILFTMQRPEDSSLKNVAYSGGKYNVNKYIKFIDSALGKIRKVSNKKIRVRLHPVSDWRMKQQVSIFKSLRTPNLELSNNYHGRSSNQGGSGGAGLYEDFAGAFAVVGINSNTLVESVCEGKPTWALCSGCMAWDVCNHDLSTISDEYKQHDRTQWLNNMGYTQWRHDEILAGEPIKHLLKNYEQARKTFGWS